MAFGQEDGDDDEGYGKPVEEGKTYEVQIDDLGSKGDGIARVDGFVVFVPETEIGEQVEVEINSVGRRFAFGEVTDRLGMAEDVDGEDTEEADEEPLQEEDDLEEAEDDLDKDLDEDLDEDLEEDLDVEDGLEAQDEALDPEPDEVVCEKCGEMVEDLETHECA